MGQLTAAGDGRPGRALVPTLIAADLAVWAVAVGRGPAPSTRGLVTVLLLAAAFAAVGSLQIRLSLTQNRLTITLTDAVLVVGLFCAGAPWIGLAAGLAEVWRGGARRRPLLKTAFNASSHAAATTVSALAFALMARPSGPPLSAWAAVVAATGCWNLLNTLCTAWVIAHAEGTAVRPLLLQALPAAAVTTLLAAPLGLLIVTLSRLGTLYPLLALPLGAGVYCNNRYAARQRDEHLRVQRLYDATSRTAQLAADRDVASAIAEEARQLLTGTASICFTRVGTEPWSGRTARPEGVTGARACDIGHLLDLVPERGCASVVGVDPFFAGLAGGATTMVATRSPGRAPVDMVVAVFCDGGRRRSHNALGATLAALAAHGAVIAANAGLIADLRRSLEDQLQANQRKDEFVATISHELRTPLTVMLGAAQTLDRHDDRISPGDREQLLRTAIGQGHRLRALIEDLLLVAAAEQDRLPVRAEVISTDSLAGDIRSDVPSRSAELVSVTNLVPGVLAQTDRFKVRQIVTNLVGNAIKYAPGSAVEIVLDDSDGRVVISVADHGPGIAPEHREQVFDRFYQIDQSARRREGGAGLGLYICRKLASQLGAELTLEETAGGGSTFALRLPLRLARRAEDAGPSAGSAPAPPGLLRRPDGSARPTLVPAQ